MSILRNVWISFIEYRPNPAKPMEARLPLGVFITKQEGMAHIVRTALDDGELATLDEISRELLARPAELLAQEMRSALEELPVERQTPLESLRYLSEQNQMTLFISPPVKIPVRVREIETKHAAFMRMAIHAVTFYASGLTPLQVHAKLLDLGANEPAPELPPAFQIAAMQWDAQGRTIAQP